MIKLPEPVAYLWYPPKKPELGQLCFIPEPSKQLKGLGYKSTKLYTEDQLKQAIRDALDETACLFSQDHVEYFGREIRDTILKLKEELK